MMDHLAEAKVRIYRSVGDIGHTYAQLHAIRAIAHALIAIAECARLAIEDGKKSE